jgi:hypothetical protein
VVLFSGSGGFGEEIWSFAVRQADSLAGLQSTGRRGPQLGTPFPWLYCESAAEISSKVAPRFIVLSKHRAKTSEEYMRNSPVVAASATYRKAVTGIATAVNKTPLHSRYPSVDLNVALQGIPVAMREKALEWYVRGIKRGMAKATDLMVEKKIYLKGDEVCAPATMAVNVQVKFSDTKWKPLKLKVRARDIGFK